MKSQATANEIATRLNRRASLLVLFIDLFLEGAGVFWLVAKMTTSELRTSDSSEPQEISGEDHSDTFAKRTISNWTRSVIRLIRLTPGENLERRAQSTKFASSLSMTELKF